MFTIVNEEIVKTPKNVKVVPSEEIRDMMDILGGSDAL
jgi:hypothetical protein